MRDRLPFIFIVITVIIDAMGVGLIMPVTPALVRELTGQDISGAAIWGGALMFTFAIMQFLFMPIVGNLSDKVGRRPVLLVSMFIMGVDYLLHAIAPTIWLLFLARIIAGIMGATYTTATAFLADVSSKENRAANFGLVGAAFGIGFIIGPAIGGLLGEYGTRAPFYAAAALALVNAVFGYFVLPESLKPENRRPFQWHRANPFGAFMRIRQMPALMGLFMVVLFFDIAHMVYPAIWSFYTIEAFKWSEGMVGFSLAAYGLAVVFMQGGAIRPMIKNFGERRTTEIGLIAAIFSGIVLVFIKDGWMIFAFIPVLAVSEVAGPAISAMMANRVGDDEQGELQGILGSLASVGMIISLLIMPVTFRIFTKPDAPIYLPGAPFLVAAALTLLALILLIRIPKQDGVSPQTP